MPKMLSMYEPWKPKRKTLPQEKVQQILSYFDKLEYTGERVAQEVGCAVMSVFNHWRRVYGDEAVNERKSVYKTRTCPGRKISTEVIEAIAAEFYTDTSGNILSYKYGVSNDTVYRIFKERYGIEAYKKRCERVKHLSGKECGKVLTRYHEQQRRIKSTELHCN